MLQLCPTLCNPIDGSPPDSPVPAILQARTLEWVAISFSNAWKWKVKVKSLSRVWLLATPWPATYQAPPSTGFSRQEYWSGLPLPSACESITILKFRDSLVVQWLRIHLVIQGAQLQSLIQEDPTCFRTAKPMYHNYWSLYALESVFCNEKPLQWEAYTPQL